MRRVGVEFRRSYERRIEDGFIARYLSGEHVLDIGYRGGDPEAVPVTESAIGVDLDFPGYDGVHLPFPDESQDAVFASHVLEHVPNSRPALVEWNRVLKIGGYLIIFVPHRDLYERRPDLPSLWNADHRRFYTPASLLDDIETALPVAGYRVRHLADNDRGFDYSVGPLHPPKGCYEIELVIEKIKSPDYANSLRPSPAALAIVQNLNSFFLSYIESAIRNRSPHHVATFAPLVNRYIVPWQVVTAHFANHSGVNEAALRTVLRPLLETVEIEVAWYTRVYPDLARHPDPAAHWRSHGYFEGRSARDFWPIIEKAAKSAEG